MVLLQRKLYFSRIQRGSSIFQGGSNFFQGGPNANIYRHPYNLCFSRGVQAPYPPLDPHMTYMSGQKMYACADQAQSVVWIGGEHAINIHRRISQRSDCFSKWILSRISNETYSHLKISRRTGVGPGMGVGVETPCFTLNLPVVCFCLTSGLPVTSI